MVLEGRLFVCVGCGEEVIDLLSKAKGFYENDFVMALFPPYSFLHLHPFELKNSSLIFLN